MGRHIWSIQAEVMHEVSSEAENSVVDVESEGGAPPSTSEFKREVYEFGKMIVWFLLLFCLLKYCVIEGYEVQGPSMQPTLNDRERILVLKLPHILSQISFFSWIDAIGADDIVVFKSPDDGHKRYVKRVIARGPAKSDHNAVRAVSTTDAGSSDSEIVNIDRDGRIYIHNQFKEYVFHDELERDMHPVREQTVVLDPGEYYVMGDNRGVSKDSRSFGSIPDESIIGKAVVRFWPPSKFSLLR